MEIDGYLLDDPEAIDTPAFLVYEDMVQHNIGEVLRVCGSVDRLVAHAKTHKSTDVLNLQIAAGIRSYKCATLREAEMLADANVDEIVIAYPMLHPRKRERLVSLMQKFPKIEVKAIVSTPDHLAGLSESMVASGLELGVYLDLDTGMRRTGAQPGAEAGEIYVQAAQTPGLRALGVHVFDGHTLYKPDEAERQALVDTSIGYMHEVWEVAERHGIAADDNLAGGSWSFHLYLGEDANKVRVTPGTWVYWDSRNATIPELDFKVAAVVLGQVIDSDPGMDTVTTDLGSKTCSPDQPMEHRFKLVGYPAAELTAQSEEHGVLRLNGETLAVGDLVLAAPGHACTTTVKFPYALVVDSGGQIAGRYDHDARDR